MSIWGKLDLYDGQNWVLIHHDQWQIDMWFWLATCPTSPPNWLVSKSEEVWQLEPYEHFTILKMNFVVFTHNLYNDMSINY